MNITRGMVGVILVVTIVGATPLAGSVGGSSTHFDIGISDSIDTPTRTVTVDGEDYTVSSIAQRVAGGSLVADISAPSSDTEYHVYLYNSDSKVEQSVAMTGSGQAAFDTDPLPAGGYYVAVYHDSEIVTIHPVVIAAYDVSLDISPSADSGETVSATIDVTPHTRDRPPETVQLVIGDDQEALTVTASESSTNTYTATFDANLPAGGYIAYGVTRGENTTDSGETELVGVSGGHTVSITDPTATSTASDGSDTSGEDSGDVLGNGTATTSATPTTATTATPSTPTTDTATPSDSPTATDTPTTTADDVITPRTGSSPSPTQTTATDGPGLGVALALVALVTSLGVVRTWRR